ncbi:hypothetical protein CR513_37340, partial [Mucuna pruriens]
MMKVMCLVAIHFRHAVSLFCWFGFGRLDLWDLTSAPLAVCPSALGMNMSRTFNASIRFTLLVSQNIRSGRLRAFAFARLESYCCFYPSLDV